MFSPCFLLGFSLIMNTIVQLIGQGGLLVEHIQIWSTSNLFDKIKKTFVIFFSSFVILDLLAYVFLLNNQKLPLVQKCIQVKITIVYV